MRPHLLLALLLVLAMPAWAASDYETLDAQTPWTTENGHETRSLVFPQGVIIDQERRGNKISSTGFDNSGHGAVLCLAQIYQIVQVESEMCTSQDVDWAGEIRTALDRVYTFIAANSLKPVTKTEVVASAEKQMTMFREQAREHFERIGDKARICQSVNQAGFGVGIKRMGIDAFHANTDAALAIPRPPVMNPCM